MIFVSYFGLFILKIIDSFLLFKFTPIFLFVYFNKYLKKCIYKKSFYTLKINNLLNNLNLIYRRKLIVFSIGFKFWCLKKKNVHLIMLKIGYSNDICIEIPKSLILICLKPSLILVKSFDLSKLTQFISFLRLLKKPDSYKGKGIRYLDEKIILKTNKQA